MNPRRLVPVLAACAILSVVPARAAPEVVIAERTGATAKKILDRSERVIIAGFRVAFNLEGAASTGTDARLADLGHPADNGPRTVTSDAAVSMKVNLTGVGADDFQRITEEAYADFKAQLVAAGVTVLGPEVLKASKGYAGLTFTPSTKDQPYARDLSVGAGRKVVVYSPAELPLFLGHYDGGNLSAVTMNLGNWRALNQLSVEAKAVVLVPTVFVDFVKMKPDGRGRMMRPDAAVGADPQIALVGKQSNVAVFHAKIRLAGDLGNFHLDEDLAVSGQFGELRQVSVSDNAALNASLEMLTGRTGHVSSSTQHVLAADPAAYRHLTLQGLKTFNRAAGQFIAAK